MAAIDWSHVEPPERFLLENTIKVVREFVRSVQAELITIEEAKPVERPDRVGILRARDVGFMERKHMDAFAPSFLHLVEQRSD